eukprot:Nitzschia sp. Nitz4//scaffold46_size129759//126483//129611//NITZ4_003529-RA/size129759-processed-gene-0.175-mRNA-1//-1//CDS//3329552679//1093//frame0
MRFSWKLVLSSLLVAGFTPSNAVLVEEAGVLDFRIATAGHGAPTFAHSTEGTVLTTDTSSCYVANRNVEDGDLLWRRNVCAKVSPSSSHALAMSQVGQTFATMDNAGVVRSWTRDQGKLRWDAKVSPAGTPKVWTVTSADAGELVAAASDGDLVLLSASSGSPLGTFQGLSFVERSSYRLREGEHLEWLSIVSVQGQIHGVLAFVTPEGTTSGDRMLHVELQTGSDSFSSVQPMSYVRSPIVASTFETQLFADSWNGMALTPSQSLVQFGLGPSNFFAEPSVSSWHPDWERIVAVQATPESALIQVQGVNGAGEESMGLFRFDLGNSARWEQLYASSEGANTQFGAVAYCPKAELVMAAGSGLLMAYRHDSLSGTEGGNLHDQLSPLTTLSVEGDAITSEGSPIQYVSVVECTPAGASVLVSTARGTSTVYSFAVSDNSVKGNVRWTAEEGLASASSAVVLDATHMGMDDLVEEQDTVAAKLSLPSRLASQMDTLVSLVSGSQLDASFSRRDHVFGFVKTAAMLSQSAHRIWGVTTSGADRGSIRWMLNLPVSAKWHTMVHGTTNSKSSLNGVNGGTDSREILVLSSLEDSVQWKCIDGTSGVVHSEDLVSSSSPISQIIPIYGSTGGCRQAALLLHDDHTFSVVPNDEGTLETFNQQLSKTPNGMFTHVIDKADSRLESFKIVAGSGGFTPVQVGRTSFTGERIVKVAYPTRDEVVQTRSTILGDNSLLLKYINPHMAVVVTVAGEDAGSKNGIVDALDKAAGKSNRKPAGAGETANVSDTKTDDADPNLFVNIVDTVSGRVLYRASHANADIERDVVALVSENWVLYSYTNGKSRRTEIGVLTLHEGMIDKEGISLFKSPEQTTTFSSFDARESKPVVLAKTYTYPKFITAMGVTSTRGGISSRQVLIASDDGKIGAIGRPLFETRRPLGQVKEAEKKEGLIPYTELIMQVPQASITTNNTIDGVKSLVSASTALESQALVIAFGGPDLFFARTSPSKGFDLLPDSFSRIFVAIVTVGLVIVLFVTRYMSSKKISKLGWL